MTDLAITMGIIAIFGMVGGVVNAIINGDSIRLPRWSRNSNTLELGVLGNTLIGAVAAIVSWGLYNQGVGMTNLPLEIAGAVLVGMGGARVLTGILDKNTLSRAVTAAAMAPANDVAAALIDKAKPAQALEIATRMLKDDNGHPPPPPPPAGADMSTVTVN